MGAGRWLLMAWVARVCPLCPGKHVGDQRQYVFECPAFDDIHRGFRHLFDGTVVMGSCVYYAAPMPEGRCFVPVAAL